jgi:hypothetical protein
MRRPWMTVVKKNRQTTSDYRIKRRCCLEQLLLHLARQFRPEPERCMTQQLFELGGPFVHFISSFDKQWNSFNKYKLVVLSS